MHIKRKIINYMVTTIHILRGGWFINQRSLSLYRSLVDLYQYICSFLPKFSCCLQICKSFTIYLLPFKVLAKLQRQLGRSLAEFQQQTHTGGGCCLNLERLAPRAAEDGGGPGAPAHKRRNATTPPPSRPPTATTNHHPPAHPVTAPPRGKPRRE